MDDTTLTPMMRQYREIKLKAPPDAILLFRMGDFYEMFFEDAKKGSEIFEVTLTKRQGIPMCGVPHHALDSYLPRAVEAGIKLAIADQVEDPKLAQGIVKRELTRVITPGTVMDSSMLSPAQSNYLVAITTDKKGFGLARLDISTGDFQVTELDDREALVNELLRLAAKECVVPDSVLAEWNAGHSHPIPGKSVLWTPLDDWHFMPENAAGLLLSHLGVASLDGFGCAGMRLATGAAGAALRYAMDNLKRDAKHVTTLKTYHTGDYMVLDPATRRNLELIEPTRSGGKAATLIGVLDHTRTPMGGRLLRDWILSPLRDRQRINERLECVDALKFDPLTLGELRETLGAVRDLERIIARLNVGGGNARDLVALVRSLEIIPDINRMLAGIDVPILQKLRAKLIDFGELTSLIDKAIAPEPPLAITDGGIIRDGYDPALDELRRASTEGKNWIAALQTKEQERTGIKNLKVRFNNVFGYFIEITKSNLAAAPADYTRKQTLVNAERFITPELKELESKVLGSEDKSKALELEIFQAVRQRCVEHTIPIRETAAAIAGIDVLASFAEAARLYNYCRPIIKDDGVLEIRGGRHPVLDATLKEERFVPNDTHMDIDADRIIIITGPNMAGKSTYIRQVALLVLMAQTGSFIPAEHAEIGVVDRIFTRVGASDDLAKGQSTFMVEMVETANILAHATPRSLIVLDEIGRGTSTFDGLSIAWAVAEFLHDNAAVGAKTLFATHYHELTELALTCKGVKNYNVAVREYGDKIVFLRQIIPGGADKSYGIYVAKLAGLPPRVIDRAKEILENLERGAIKDDMPTLAKHRPKQPRKPQEKEIPESATVQPRLFDF